MIYAAFDGQSREAVASDVFQYDTGEALELSGLPGELGGVAVEVHFGYEGDAKAEARIAQFDKRGGVWRADVPDVYLQRARAVNAYVYVIETELKKRTLYRVTFSPIERPAPSTEVTQAQADAWAQLVVEVNGAVAGADAAAGRANAAAANLTTEGEKWEARIQEVERRTPGSMVTEVSRKTVSVPTSGWTKNAQGMQELSVNIAGTKKESTTQRVDVAVQGEQIGRVLLAGARVDTDDTLTLVCLDVPPAAFELMVIVGEVIP